MPPLLLVMLGGAIGAGCRYGVGTIALRNFGAGFPWGTMFVNLIGGLLMGLLAGILSRQMAGGEDLRLFAGVGVLGGFTTFSAFSLEAYTMFVRGEGLMAGAYAVSSFAGSLLLLAGGVWLARGIA
jgi:CrcB protein